MGSYIFQSESINVTNEGDNSPRGNIEAVNGKQKCVNSSVKEKSGTSSYPMQSIHLEIDTLKDESEQQPSVYKSQTSNEESHDEHDRGDIHDVNVADPLSRTSPATKGKLGDVNWTPQTAQREWTTAHISTANGYTLAHRLQPTLDVALAEKDKYTLKAQWTGWSLNIAIGVQVLLGSLTTGLSAVAVSGGRSTAVATTVLGALATLVASYLARARGSNEPELSIARVKDLEQFIRDCEALKMDHGHTTGHDFDNILKNKRRRLENLLGNMNEERRMAPPV